MHGGALRDSRERRAVGVLTGRRALRRVLTVARWPSDSNVSEVAAGDSRE